MKVGNNINIFKFNYTVHNTKYLKFIAIQNYQYLPILCYGSRKNLHETSIEFKNIP